jgi:aerobic-type carbon monoxide dehydrogenase small subunit (CoxS/CutS family)
MASGALRNGPDGTPRGLFCGIGICFDCLVTIDGRPGLRACMVRVHEQMDVKVLVR